MDWPAFVTLTGTCKIELIRARDGTIAGEIYPATEIDRQLGA